VEECVPVNGNVPLDVEPFRPATAQVTGAGSAAVVARGKRPPSGEPVVDRGLALLGAFDSEHRSLSLGELSRRSAIPTSSALRLANRLVAWGALERHADGRFTIGLRLWQIAALAPRAHGLREVAVPYMRDLSEVTREHILLAVREGTEAVLVERLSVHRAMPVLYTVGGRLPLHSTGVGLVLLASAPAQLQEQVLAGSLMHEPEKVPVSPAALRRTLAQVRRDGLSVIRRRVPQPLVTVAAPVLDADDQVIAALSVLVPEASADPRMLGPAVRTTARAISRTLGSRRSSFTTPVAPGC
jgi:DNA-binding IclR family transcriptional regulator